MPIQLKWKESRDWWDLKWGWLWWCQRLKDFIYSVSFHTAFGCFPTGPLARRLRCSNRLVMIIVIMYRGLHCNAIVKFFKEFGHWWNLKCHRHKRFAQCEVSPCNHFSYDVWWWWWYGVLGGNVTMMMMIWWCSWWWWCSNYRGTLGGTELTHPWLT